jgi:hypothetical protein
MPRRSAAFMSDFVGGVQTPPRQQWTPAPASPPLADGLGVASLILGVTGFLPLPGIAASVLAVILGCLSGSRDVEGRRRRSGTAVTGIVLGCVSIGVFLTICIVYFGVLGHPLPQIHRYHPGTDATSAPLSAALTHTCSCPVR